MYIYTRTHTQSHTHTHPYKYLYTHTHTHTYTDGLYRVENDDGDCADDTHLPSAPAQTHCVSLGTGVCMYLSRYYWRVFR